MVTSRDFRPENAAPRSTSFILPDAGLSAGASLLPTPPAQSDGVGLRGELDFLARVEAAEQRDGGVLYAQAPASAPATAKPAAAAGDTSHRPATTGKKPLASQRTVVTREHRVHDETGGHKPVPTMRKSGGGKLVKNGGPKSTPRPHQSGGVRSTPRPGMSAGSFRP